jgi:predicted permease
MHTVWQDIRYGLRTLRANPGFATIAILTLALGIGANTALFSIVNGVLLNPLPFPEPERLVALYSHTPEDPREDVTYFNFLDWQRDNHSFSSLATFRQDDLNLTGMGLPERLKVNMVSADFFPLLGVNPVAGQLFTKQEDKLGGAPAALLSEGLWRRKFSASPDAIGKILTLNAQVYTIIGVIPGNLHFENDNFYRNAEVYLPLGQWTEPLFQSRATSMGTGAVGRLKPDVTLEQANQDMSTVTAHLAEVYPDVNKNSGVAILALKQSVVGDVRPFLMVLLGAVGFVLLIACANVANLLLARSTSRSREFAIRVALGANRGRVMRQVLTECLLLAFVGGLLGLGIAAWGTTLAIKLLPDALPRAAEVHLDGRVLVFALLASVLAGLLFGLIPALKTAGTDVHGALKEGGRGGSGTRHATQRLIVAMEMALAVVLLTAAGLMIRSLGKLWNVSPGFDPNHVVTFSLTASQPLGSTPAGIRSALRALHESVAAVPGLEAVALRAGSSVMTEDTNLHFWLEGEAKPTAVADMKNALLYATQPDYLKIMKIPLLEGRFLSGADNESTAPVIVIDQEFARRFFAGTDPIGKRVNFDILNFKAEIVGLVGHVKQYGLDSDLTAPIQAQFYLPLSQITDAVLPVLAHRIQGVARTRETPTGEIDAITQAVQSVNSGIVVFDTQPMTEVVAATLTAKRFVMILLGSFAALATLLSSIGIYGVISYIASQRTHEIGVRMALGAGRREVLRLVLGQAGKMALIGVAIGLVAALGLTQLLSSMLYGVSSHDPLTFFAVAILLSLIALAACLIPAQRATRVDPMIALRYE